MMTGSRSAFVISWAQTEVDGLAVAPRAALGVGASWRWSGEAVRVDGPQDVLRLEGAFGEAELRERAARKMRRVMRLATPQAGHVPDDPILQMGFDVTDGFDRYVATLVDTGKGPALVVFHDQLPPRDTDLWVVRAQMEAVETNRVTGMSTGVICFTPGTRIRTARGDVAVEEIVEGDRVQTRDSGMQEVLWQGHRRITGARLFAMPELRPIRLRGGALGIDRPEDDLIVSPLHRVLVKGARAKALFGTDEVLVSARDLVNDRTIVRDLSLREVTYVHLLLPHHEVVFANGLETESFHPAGEAIDALEEGSRERLLGLMPELGDDPLGYGDFARRTLNRAEAAILMAGHH